MNIKDLNKVTDLHCELRDIDSSLMMNSNLIDDEVSEVTISVKYKQGNCRLELKAKPSECANLLSKVSDSNLVLKSKRAEILEELEVLGVNVDSEV